MQRGLEVAEITHLRLELIVNYPIIISSGRLGLLSRCSFLLSHPNTVKFISRVYTAKHTRKQVAIPRPAKLFVLYKMHRYGY